MASGAFYKGRKKKQNIAIIIAAVLLALLFLVVILFYGLQKYAVITKDEVNIRISGTGNSELEDAGRRTLEYELVDVSLKYDEPSYSSVEQTSGKGTDPFRAIFVPYNKITRADLSTYADRISKGNALVLEMKPRDGYVMWHTQAVLNQSLGVEYIGEIFEDLPAAITEYHEKGLKMAAQISCLVDNAVGTRSYDMQLRSYNGFNYTDKTGSWLCPYNLALREYIVTLVGELYDMGFDEVILADVSQPLIEWPENTPEEQKQMLYTRTTRASQNALYGVSSFATAIAGEFEERNGKLLSVASDDSTALINGYNSVSGQDYRLFMKIFDRIYYETDMYAYQYMVPYSEDYVTVGNLYDRFVPVVYNYLPDNTSWVLKDTE